MPNYRIRAELKPRSGEAIELDHILSLSWRAWRSPGPNNNLGQVGHQVDEIVLTRHKSLPNGEQPAEDRTVAAAAAREQDAFHSGEITVARPEDPTNPVQTIRFDEGHVTSIQQEINGSRFVETLNIAVKSLQVDDNIFEPEPAE